MNKDFSELKSCSNNVVRYKKIHNRYYDNLIVYFNSERIYKFKKEKNKNE